MKALLQGALEKVWKDAKLQMNLCHHTLRHTEPKMKISEYKSILPHQHTMLSCFLNYQHTNNADPWEGGRRLADLSHRGEVSEAAKELHRAECNVLATIF